MARYRKIDVRVWNDKTFAAFPDDVKLLFLFLLTHPSLTSLGAMRHTRAGLAEELRWPSARFTRAFQVLIDKQRVRFDADAAYVWLPNFLRYNQPESPNVVRGWASAMDLLPECPLRQQTVATAQAFVEGLGEAFAKAFAEGFRKPSPNQEQEQEPEQEQTRAPRPALVTNAFGHTPAQRRTLMPWESAIGVDVTPKLHREFSAKLANAGVDDVDSALHAWYRDTEAAYHGKDIGEDAHDFWRARFKEWRGTTPAAKRTTERIAGTGHSLCQHEPRCTSLTACRDRVLADVRAEQARTA